MENFAVLLAKCQQNVTNPTEKSILPGIKLPSASSTGQYLPHIERCQRNFGKMLLISVQITRVTRYKQSCHVHTSYSMKLIWHYIWIACAHILSTPKGWTQYELCVPDFGADDSYKKYTSRTSKGPPKYTMKYGFLKVCECLLTFMYIEEDNLQTIYFAIPTVIIFDLKCY